MGTLALAVGLLGPRSEAARLGPPEGSSAWVRGQRLLERPAAALVAAREAQTRGDRLRAEWLLAEIALRHPVIADYADLMRAEILLASSRGAEAAAVATTSLETHPGTLLQPDLLAVQGHALAQLQNEKGARDAWRTALDSTRESALRASLLLATAASQERTGEGESAIETYRLLWRLYPLADEAGRAAARLDEIEAARGRPLRSAVDWRRRGDNLFRARRNPQALAAYEKALEEGLSRSEEGRVRHRRAQTLFRMREYPRAVDAFANLPQVDDVPIWHARSMARSDRVPEAIAEFERIAAKRGGPNALRARFLAALLLEGRGKTERSRNYLQSLTRDRVASSVRRASLWRLAWGAYREASHAAAIGYMDRLIAEDRDPIGGLRTRYWRARALEALGRGPEGDAAASASARIQLEMIAVEYPLTYYGWRARLRIPDLDDSLASTFPEPKPLEPGQRKVSAGELTRVRILVEAGFEERALEELARFSKRAGGLDDRLELAQLFRSAGHFNKAQRMVVDPYKLILTRAPSPTLEDLWWHAWPAAYLDLVEEETRRPGSVDSALVFSIMREESGFRPTVVSPVGARGLLQIMEPTGERLARDVGQEGFVADDLFEPRINIRLGAHYLAQLSDRFDGRLSAAIASYNAGPEAVAGWLEERGELEDDEWVESIPYEQTRSYVKRVLRSLQAYRLLY